MIDVDGNADAPSATPRSAALFSRARTLIPGGVNSPVRAFSAVGGIPRFAESGSGPYLSDVDGNRLIDYVMSWGPLIHGHAFPPVVEAVERAVRHGTTFGVPTEAEVTLAEMVVESVSSIEMVRFVNSGTEAAMSAIRLARAFTGREIIVKFAGNYHGHADMLLARAGSGSLTLGVPSSPGVPAGAAASTLVAAYNDGEGLRAIFEEHGAEIAAVIVEPIAGNMGVVEPLPDFLPTLQRLSGDAGALFICDEVITGFRVAEGGAQAALDLHPDLTVLGKIVGGGLPVGAYGGRREIMERVAPAGPVYQAGTLSGNPLAMAAGMASVHAVRTPGFYASLAGKSERLRTGLVEAAARAGAEVCVNAVTGMLTVFMTAGPVESLADAESSDTRRYARFFHAMLDRGVSLPPSQYEAWMVSAAHSDELIDRTVDAAQEAFALSR